MACNLRCRHCASSAGRPRSNELNTKEILNISDQLPDLLVQEVDFTGGEPLMHPDWEEIALHLKDLGITTQIITNGLALNQETVSRIKDAGIQGVAISLDGLEQTHDHIRAYDGAFKQVMKGIDLIQRVGIPVTILTTGNSLNYRELPDVLKLLSPLGVKRWRIQPLIPSGRVQNSPEMGMNMQILSEIEAFISEYEAVARSSDILLMRSDGLGYHIDSKPDENPWLGCSAGLATCSITSDGKVKGCLALPDDLVEGDLRKNELWDIWFHPDAFAFTRKFSLDDMGSNCRSCDRNELCRGGCSAKSYSNTGLFHNDPYCLYDGKCKGGERLVIPVMP